MPGININAARLNQTLDELGKFGRHPRAWTAWLSLPQTWRAASTPWD